MLRRRLLNSSSQDSHYVVVTHDIKDISSPTMIFGYNTDTECFKFNQVDHIVVDGVKYMYYDSRYFQFNTTGKHIVKIKFNEHLTTLYSFLRKCNTVTSVKFGSSLTCNTVISHRAMFMDCVNLKYVSFPRSFDTSNSTDIGYAFQNCSKITSLDLSMFNTSKVTDMDRVFYNCARLTYLNLDGWNINETRKMSSIFHTCENLTSINVANWKGSLCKNFWASFCGMAKLTKIDLSNIDTSSANYLNYMFMDSRALIEIKMGGPTSSTADVTDMFNNITTNGKFYYNKKYDYSKIIKVLPSTWQAIPY